ncbi:phosphohistidine phosphatase SixA [Gammaproteobacteria bacterium]|nr:phosphohistidine phosphatase SixA [Gammaproteobacteria bacterium]
MNIYLLRHGQAERSADKDSLRNLTPSGVEDIKVLARTFATMDLTIDRCFASPYHRAQQTAELFLSGSSLACSIESNAALRPDNSPVKTIRLLEEADKTSNILLVGHNPFLSELYGMLTLANSDYGIKTLAAGELCGIHFDLFGLGLGREVLNMPPGKN